MLMQSIKGSVVGHASLMRQPSIEGKRVEQEAPDETKEIDFQQRGDDRGDDGDAHHAGWELHDGAGPTGDEPEPRCVV